MSNMIRNKTINCYFCTIILCILFSAGSLHAQSIPLTLKDGAGKLRLGIICGEKSCWTDECKIDNSGNSYSLTGGLLKKGKLKITVLSLLDTDGIVVEVTAKNIAEDVKLCWAFGGCHGKDTTSNIKEINPQECKDNVFCLEGNAFTTYYGEVMKLKTINGVMPQENDILLVDAHKQASPIELINSSKKTDATVISSTAKLNNESPLYICLYKQNNKADYNYSLLSNLFNTTLKAKR